LNSGRDIMGDGCRNGNADWAFFLGWGSPGHAMTGLRGCAPCPGLVVWAGLWMAFGGYGVSAGCGGLGVGMEPQIGRFFWGGL
jgi:hypothetical protein